MALSFIDHFSGADGQTCSYTTKFISDNAQKAKDLGMNEANYRKGFVNGHLGFLDAKHTFGEIQPGTVLMRGKYGAINGPKPSTITFSYKGFDEVKMVTRIGGTDFTEVMSWDDFKSFIYSGLNKPQYSFSVPSLRPAAVSPSSKSVGALTDEDAAILFVKTKDQFAKDKGINIKGANPQLDLEVYESVAKVTGYSPDEIRLKIEAYKASGKKLSSLKKQVLAGKKDVKLPDLVEAPPKKSLDILKEQHTADPEIDWIDLLMESDYEKPKDFEFIEHQYGDSAGWKAKYKGNDAGAVTETDPFWGGTGNSKGVQYVFDPKKKDGTWKSPEGPFDSLTDAKNAAKAHAEKEFDDAPDLVQPPEIHTTPSKPAVQEAVEDLKEKDAADALLYSDEDIVKAYIKAKDHVAGSDQNQFTLYSKGPEFDMLIRGEMKDLLQTTKLTQAQVDKAIANYLGDGNKLSVLKKKMVKSGEMKKQADTLKKTKAEKQFETSATVSHAEAQAQIDAMAQAAVEPVGSGNRYSFSLSDEDELFNSLKNSIYAASSPQNLFTNFYQKAVEWEKKTGKKVSALDIMRIYDKKKAVQLGIDNGFFYEKKLAEWSSTSAGQQSIHQLKNAAQIAAEKKIKQEAEAALAKAKQEAADKLINQDIPDLPADSANFKAYTRNQSVEIQNRMEPWKPEEKAGLRTYTGGSYREMNGYLRKGSRVSESMRDSINNAQKGMRPVDVEMLTMRGCSYKQFGFDSSAYGFDAATHLEVKSLVGQKIQDKGFMSTSSASNYGGHSAAFGGTVRLEVEIPKGTYGAYVDHISLNQGENEYIVAAGTEFRVLRVTKEGSSTVVRVRAIPGSHAKGRL